MKLVCDFPAENLELYSNDLQHQLYLMAMGSSFTDTAKKIKNAKRVMIKPFICGDDCSGHYKKVKISVFIEE